MSGSGSPATSSAPTIYQVNFFSQWNSQIIQTWQKSHLYIYNHKTTPSSPPSPLLPPWPTPLAPSTRTSWSRRVEKARQPRGEGLRGGTVDLQTLRLRFFHRILFGNLMNNWTISICTKNCTTSIRNKFSSKLGAIAGWPSIYLGLGWNNHLVPLSPHWHLCNKVSFRKHYWSQRWKQKIMHRNDKLSSPVHMQQKYYWCWMLCADEKQNALQWQWQWWWWWIKWRQWHDDE